jgi:hypothetical protein
MSKIVYNTHLIKTLKYLIMFIVTYFLGTYIPNTSLSNQELITIAILVSVTYGLLEIQFPCVYIDNFVV